MEPPRLRRAPRVDCRPGEANNNKDDNIINNDDNIDNYNDIYYYF